MRLKKIEERNLRKVEGIVDMPGNPSRYANSSRLNPNLIEARPPKALKHPASYAGWDGRKVSFLGTFPLVSLLWYRKVPTSHRQETS